MNGAGMIDGIFHAPLLFLNERTHRVTPDVVFTMGGSLPGVSSGAECRLVLDADFRRAERAVPEHDLIHPAEETIQGMRQVQSGLSKTDVRLFGLRWVRSARLVIAPDETTVNVKVR